MFALLFLHQNESVEQLHYKAQIETHIIFMQERFTHIYSNCRGPVNLDASSRGCNCYCHTSLSHIHHIIFLKDESSGKQLLLAFIVIIPSSAFL